MSDTRVLVIAPWGEALGGAETMLLQLLEETEAAACQFDVAFLQDGPFVADAVRRGATTFVIPAGRLRDVRKSLRTVRALARLIRERQPQAVLAWSAKMQLYAAPAVALSRTGVSLVWWQHGIPQNHRLDRLATRLPASAVGCSSHAAARAQAALRPHRRSFVVHPGIREPEPGDHFAPNGGSLVVGIVGRLQPWKGQDRFLRALAEVRHDGFDIRGLIVGGDAYGLSPDYASHVEALTAQLGLTEHVTMTGQVEDATPYLRGMDVLVNASEEEPFGIVLLEAMACRAAVVAVARGGPLEIIRSSENGILVPSGHPADLASGIRKLVTDEALRRRVTEAARQTFSERFSARRMGERLGEELRAAAIAHA